MRRFRELDDLEAFLLNLVLFLLNYLPKQLKDANERKYNMSRALDRIRKDIKEGELPPVPPWPAQGPQHTLDH